ncbi:fungal-specific transcription factor domain-containing protein [Neohortaea acidophila]|uniref:Fungal-specific transcription factor domain-containing protein n=1 Tax=Neohortaea acidophila TaxID=245834 RepID=A0A6A6PQD4_9PEZI|nr:fungal-specific transcription factor domain-containing protein [Neohortaea acidophila]KAF2482318.1 fungal-specific transcription factor domain-containing protein [Neohortaea acidophila]
MAAAIAMQPLAPRPSPHHIAPAWSSPVSHPHYMDGKENRPVKKQSTQPSAPSNARSRRERPCDGCRRRKSKCVLQHARRCVLCEFHKQDCTFVENAQPRKRKADEMSSKPEEAATAAKKQDSVIAEPVTTPSSPLAQEFSSVTDYASDSPNPYAVDQSLSLQRHSHCTYLGPTTALDASLIGLSSFDDNNETASYVGTLRHVTDGEYFSIHSDADVPIPDDEARALAEIDALIGPHGPALIDLYFHNVHPNYPIMQKKTFLDRHRHGDRHFNPPLLAAMYLLAMDWWHSDPELSQHPRPDADRLEYIAITGLNIAMQRPKISAVQAGLLLLQRAKSSTWTLTVQLVALGQDIGLHLDCTEWSIPLWERRLRKRLAWALYMQDKWSALMHGRPSHINAADWAVQPPVASDFDDNLDPEPSEPAPEAAKGRSLFMHMISLTSIMAEVCSTFYSQTAKAEFARAGRYATQLVLNRAKPVQIKLKDWFAKLPPECKMDSPALGPHHLSSTGYLHLGYFATEISIHRRIVQSLNTATADPYMLYICRSAAKTRLISAMDFANRLQPAHLDAFWYFASAANFALIGTFGALLMATAPGKEEAEFYSWRLREFRWTLAVSARKAAWIASAAEMLEANLEMVARVPEKEAAVEMKRREKVVEVAEVEHELEEQEYDDDELEVDGWDEQV